MATEKLPKASVDAAPAKRPVSAPFTVMLAQGTAKAVECSLTVPEMELP